MAEEHDRFGYTPDGRFATVQTAIDIEAALGFIESVKGDDEAAHSYEDELWERVLVLISEGHPNAQRMAAQALRTKQIKFARWCA